MSAPEDVSKTSAGTSPTTEMTCSRSDRIMTQQMLPLMHPREFLYEFPLTYRQLAQQLGVTVYAVDNWMGNRSNPSKQTQRQVADFAARLKENAQLRKLVLATERDE